MKGFKFSWLDFLFTCGGLVSLLADIVLDIVAAVDFYQEKAYVSLGLLLLFLVGSSVLVQAYSWLWYGYENFKTVTKVEKSLSSTQLKLLHVFQLGIYIRHAGVMEMSVKSFLHDPGDPEGHAVFLSHDLSMLRLIETFAEGTPQVVLMVALILRRGELGAITVLKAIGSISAIAYSVTMYHRSLRSFLVEKEMQTVWSSVVYFAWNLLLIMSRLTALALFASVLPCFILTHFFCSWLVLFFIAWQCKTDFMDSPGGEWLYRATVGLIWYFDWFNILEGKTRNSTLLYHGYILVDMSVLCGLWCWKISTEPHNIKISLPYAVITAVSVSGVYILGLLIKIIYYKCCHPNLAKDDLKGDTSGQEPAASYMMSDVTDCSWPTGQDAVDGISPAPAVKYNKRMRKLAENFYT